MTYTVSNFLAYVIIGIVAAILIGAAVIKFVDLHKETRDQTICWQSINEHSQLVQLTEGETQPDINCPTRFDTISKKKTNTEAVERVARYWAECWREWHKGNAILFRKSGVYCHVCQVIEFEEREKLEGLFTYLNTFDVDDLNNPLISVEFAQYREKPKIYSYLLPYSTDQTTNLEDLPIDTSTMTEQQFENLKFDDTVPIGGNNYAIVIVYAKGQDAISEFLAGRRVETAVAGGGMVIGGVAAAGIGIIAASGWTGVGLVVGGAVLVTGGVIALWESWTGGDPPDHLSMSMFIKYNTENIQNLGCEYLPAHQR